MTGWWPGKTEYHADPGLNANVGKVMQVEGEFLFYKRSGKLNFDFWFRMNLFWG